MATIRIVLGIFCLAFFGWAVKPGSYTLGSDAFRGLTIRVGKPLTEKRKLPNANFKLILAIAQSQLGVHEATGKNDGVSVERYLHYTNNKKGEPWCASFISWVYGQAGHAQPKTAWSPHLFPIGRQTLSPLPADIFGIYFPDLGRIAHCGLVERSRGNWIYSIEGNTNVAGNREGDGVYRKLRHKRNIKVYAAWIDEPRKEVMK